MGCEQSTLTRENNNYFDYRWNNAFKCEECNLVQARDNARHSNDNQHCLICNSNSTHHLRINWREGVTFQDQLPAPRPRYLQACWQRCIFCDSLQFTKCDVCEFCLLTELTDRDPAYRQRNDSFRNQAGIRRLLNIYQYALLSPIVTATTTPIREYAEQQVVKRDNGSIWLIKSIYPFDPLTEVPGVTQAITMALLDTERQNRGTQQAVLSNEPMSEEAPTAITPGSNTTQASPILPRQETSELHTRPAISTGDYTASFSTIYRSYKCQQCNLIQRRPVWLACRCCGAHADQMTSIDPTPRECVGLQDCSPVRVHVSAQWGRCCVCHTVQYSTCQTCQFCLVDVLTQTTSSRYLSADNATRNNQGIQQIQQVYRSCMIRPLSTGPSAPTYEMRMNAAQEFMTQQAGRKARGDIWAMASIYHFDPTGLPGVSPGQLYFLSGIQQSGGHAQDNTQSESVRPSAPIEGENNDDVAHENLSAPIEEENDNDNEVKNISMIETAEVIDKLSDLLDPDRQTVRKILLHYNVNDYYWECKLCTFRNVSALKSCEICQAERGNISLLSYADKADSQDNGISAKEIVEQAVEAIQCPICLDVYDAPITLPCGHSLCVHHAPRLKNKCPECRSPFSDEDIKKAKNKALCKNIKAVVRLARLADPERETIRNAEKRLKKGNLPQIFEVSTYKATESVKLGIVLEYIDDKLYVKRIAPGSPFINTRLQPGCRILSINTFFFFSSKDAASWLRNTVGEIVIKASI